ncbi:hypothetical protein TWF281_010178 [Arthrobotrys megalospora]
MDTPSLRQLAGKSFLLLVLSLSQVSITHGRLLEVFQSQRNFDQKKGELGGILESTSTKFYDTDPALTEDGCLNLPISDRKWTVDGIEYTPSNVNPDHRWLLKYIVIVPGADCKVNSDEPQPPPIKINIENVRDLDSAPAWLQEDNNPYFGIAYDPNVDPGTVKIRGSKNLLGVPMTDKEKFQVEWEKTQGYLENLAAEKLSEEEMAAQDEPHKMTVYERRRLELEARRTMLKFETVRYDLWPEYQFFGPVSIKLSWSDRLFHVEPGEEWRNRNQIGEEVILATGGDWVDETSDESVDP